MGTDTDTGIVLFVNKKGMLFPAEKGRYTVDPNIADPNAYPPFIVGANAKYLGHAGSTQLENGTKVGFYYHDLLGHNAKAYSILKDGGEATELKDGKYTLKNGQDFTVRHGIVQEGMFDPEKNAIIDSLEK